MKYRKSKATFSGLRGAGLVAAERTEALLREHLRADRIASLRRQRR